MIKVEVIEGALAKVEADLQQRIERGTMNGLSALALMAKNEAQRLILRGPKTGRFYGRHRASAPGEAPANDLGFLASKLAIDIRQNLTVDLAANAPYAIHLEYGTMNMAARPFMRPAAKKAGENGEKIIAGYVNEAMRQG